MRGGSVCFQAPNSSPPRVLPANRVVDRVAAQQQVDRGAGAAHRVRQPDDRVVLLLDRRAVGAFDDVEVLSWSLSSIAGSR